MFRMNGHVSLCLIVAATLSIVCSGCGSSASNSQGMSQAQAQAVSAQVSGAFAQALENAFSGGSAGASASESTGKSTGDATVKSASLSTAVTSIRPDLSSGCTPNGSGYTCNWPVSYTAPCDAGGTIAVSGDLATTLNGSGSGSLSSQLTLIPTNCGIVGTVINGDPNVGFVVNMNFVNQVPVFPITIPESGTISYGPNPSGTCALKVTNTITSENSCTMTGTLCGQSVNEACVLTQ
jgi:hypothetical protein